MKTDVLGTNILVQLLLIMVTSSVYNTHTIMAALEVRNMRIFFHARKLMSR